MLNAREAVWKDGHFGAYTRFEGEQARFPALGVNIGVLEPGQPACHYHGEDEQEDFLVLSGECILLIEGQERHLRAWDFVHCPPWTEHVFVGAVAQRELVDGVDDLAGVEHETRDPAESYAGIPADVPTGYREGWLAG